MALNTVTLTWDLADLIQSGVNATITLTPDLEPGQVLTDATDHIVIPDVARSRVFTGGTGSLPGIIACDNSHITPAGWAYTITITLANGTVLLSFAAFINFANGSTQDLSTLTPLTAATALAGAAVPGLTVFPSGDTTGATDQAAITAAEALGVTIYLEPGTFWVTGLTKQTGTIWQGSGRGVTIIKLANGSNADVIQGAGFAALTLGGTTGGVTDFAIRDLTVDGNRANQSGTSHGIRLYGYNFELTGISIQNCLSTGLYTEWAANSGGVADGMEPHYRGLKIHGCGGNGWHDRGPHDARSWDVTIWANSSTGIGYWSEASGNTTIASGSNGVNVSTFAGAGTLNAATTLNFPSASISATQGALSVATSGGTAVITYTGVTATTFTGCTTVSGSGTLTTGGAVNYVGGFDAAGQLHTQMHVYANPMYDYVLDTQTHLLDCIGEVTQAGGAMVLIRAANCMLTGGLYVIYPNTTQLGAGIQFGDTVNAASVSRIDTAVQGLAGGSAATAALNIVNDGGFNSIDLLIIQASGQAVFGNAQRDTRLRVYTTGSGSVGTDTGNSVIQEYGSVARYLSSTAQQAWTLASSATPTIAALNYRPPSNRFEHNNGITDRWFTDNFTTPALDIGGTTGHIVPRSGVSNSLTPAASNGTYATGTPSVSANASDTAGTVTATLTASPGAGSIVTVTFAITFTHHPAVVITPANIFAAQIEAYVTVFSGSFSISAAVAPPAATDSQSVSWNYIVLGQDS